MKKILRVFRIILVCAAMSLPFAYLLYWNQTPGTPPYGRTHTDANFELMDIVFYIQHLLALAVHVLLYVKHIEDRNDSLSAFGAVNAVIGISGMIASLILTWKGEIVNVSLKQTDSSARIISHADMPEPLFYGSLTVIWIGIMFCTGMKLWSWEK